MSTRSALKTADKQKFANVQQLEVLFLFTFKSRNVHCTFQALLKYRLQRLQILVREREVELERLRVELEAAQRQENAQKNYLQKFLSPT